MIFEKEYNNFKKQVSILKKQQGKLFFVENATFLEVPLLCGEKHVQSPPCIKMPAHVLTPPQGLTHGTFWAALSAAIPQQTPHLPPSLFSNHSFLRNTHGLWYSSGQSTNIYFTSKLNIHGTFTSARNFACIVFIKPHKKTPLADSNFASTLQMMRTKLWNVGRLTHSHTRNEKKKICPLGLLNSFIFKSWCDMYV